MQVNRRAVLGTKVGSAPFSPRMLLTSPLAPGPMWEARPEQALKQLEGKKLREVEGAGYGHTTLGPKANLVSGWTASIASKTGNVMGIGM